MDIEGAVTVMEAVLLVCSVLGYKVIEMLYIMKALKCKTLGAELAHAYTL